MDLKDARTLNHEELYERRKQAILLHKKGGMTQVDIGEIVGVRRDVVGKWIKKWKQGGLQALKVKEKGRPHGSEKHPRGIRLVCLG